MPKRKICLYFQVNKHATVLAMILLPKSSAPKYEFHDMKFRKEVLGECNSKKYKSETASEEEKLKQIKSGTRQQLELMNEGLVKKVCMFPNLKMKYVKIITTKSFFSSSVTCQLS